MPLFRSKRIGVLFEAARIFFRQGRLSRQTADEDLGKLSQTHSLKESAPFRETVASQKIQILPFLVS